MSSANMGVVRAFGAVVREQRRIGFRIASEMTARRSSLYYLEKLRLIHAVLTAILTASVVAVGIILWQHGRASVGDIALLTALAMTILNSTRDLAVALVNLTQQVARLEEAIGALLLPHDMADRPGAVELRVAAGRVSFQDVGFAYPERAPVLRDFTLDIRPGERVGLVGVSGAGKSTVLALLQRFYDVSSGRIRIDGQDIARGDPRKPADRHGDCAAGYKPVPPLGAGEHPLRPAERHRGGGDGGRGDGALPRLHRGSAARIRHDRWRSRGSSCPAASASAWRSRARC